MNYWKIWKNSYSSLALSTFILLSVGCSGQVERGVALLPEPKPGQVEFSPYKSQNPLTAEGQDLQGGNVLLSRTIYQAKSGVDYRIEVRDLLVGPEKSTSVLSLPGPAVLEVRSGNAVITIGSRTSELRPGRVLELPETVNFSISSGAGQPVTMRAYIFIAE